MKGGAIKKPVILGTGAGVVVVALVVALVVAFVVQHGDAGDRLARHRAAHEVARAQLTAARSDVADARDAATFTEAQTATTRADTAKAIDAATWYSAVRHTLLNDIAAAQVSLVETETKRFLVARNADQTNTCLTGISRAVVANRAGDRATAVGALGLSADACTRTLAVASGARFPYDFPDPFVLRVGGSYYAYSTNSGAGDVQVITSNDLVTWRLSDNALPGLPWWAQPGTTWAPSVLARNGTYVAYYTVRDRFANRQCISRAVSASPAGPFVDDSFGPLLCEPSGAIDPSPFVDTDGRAYLLWRAEGTPAHLLSRELTADGLALTGPAHELIGADRAFERGVVEAPSLVREGGTYFLLYSAGNWTGPSYSTAYATCAGPTGPCSKPADNRLLTSGPNLVSPGGGEIFRAADGGLHVAFHAYSAPNIGYPSNRYFYVAPLRIVGNQPIIDVTT